VYCVRFVIVGYRESNEELEVALLYRGLEEGRHLLSTQHNSNSDYKIEIMGEDQVGTKKESVSKLSFIKHNISMKE
jgi:hypothetical protein